MSLNATYEISCILPRQRKSTWHIQTVTLWRCILQGLNATCVPWREASFKFSIQKPPSYCNKSDIFLARLQVGFLNQVHAQWEARAFTGISEGITGTKQPAVRAWFIPKAACHKATSEEWRQFDFQIWYKLCLAVELIYSLCKQRGSDTEWCTAAPKPPSSLKGAHFELVWMMITCLKSETGLEKLSCSGTYTEASLDGAKN